ncbi:MAG: hypothetical protein AMXMBFR33_41630 [Candidatus Xenobia bacterium]
MEEFRKRLERIDARLDRNQRHTELVLTSQRQIMENGFDQVRLAFLEQEATIRAHAAETKDTVQELTQLVAGLEQLENPPAA